MTGGNKGIGYGIVRGLGALIKSDVVYLTGSKSLILQAAKIYSGVAARNESLGRASLQKVNEELGAKRVADIRYHQLDITNEESCRRFAEHLKKEHGGLDVLINNAGFAFKVILTYHTVTHAVTPALLDLERRH